MIANQVHWILNDQNFFDSTENWTVSHRLLRVGKDISPITSQHGLFEEALSLLQAGSDTVGNTCTIGTFYILNDSDIHSKLFDELQEVWPDSGTRITYTVLEKLPYLVGIFIIS
jgi:cytochrome P450